MSINIQSLIKGRNYSNQDICETFLCAPQGGMRRSKRTNTLVLIANHTKSIYSDIWKDGILNYTGMGQSGDQTLNGNQNITLYESDINDVSVHLFEVFKKRIYTYKGQVKLANKPYQETQDDLEGRDRSVWIFPLKVDSLSKIQQKITESENSVNLPWLPFILSSEPRKLAIQNLATIGVNEGRLNYKIFVEVLPSDLLKEVYLQHIVNALDELNINIVDKDNLFKNISNLTSNEQDTTDEIIEVEVGKSKPLLIPSADKNVINDEEEFTEETSSPINESTLDTLVADIGWSVRTTNSLTAWGILRIKDLIILSDYEILRIPNLGRLSFNEINLTLSEINQGLYNLPKKTSETKTPLRKSYRKAFYDLDLSHLEEMNDVPISSLIPLDVRTANCFIAASIRTLGDLLNMSLDDLMRIPNLGRHSVNGIRKHLLKLSKSSSIVDSTSYLLDDSSIENYIDSMESHLSKSQFLVLKYRIGFEAKPLTLEETGVILGVTRERIRQIQKEVYKKLIFEDLIKYIDKKLLYIRQNQYIPLYVNQISNYDIWFDSLKSKPWILKMLLETSKNSKHNVEKIDGDYIVTFGAKNQVTNFIGYLERFIEEQTDTFTKKDLKDHIRLLLPLMANELTNYLFQKIGANFTSHQDESKSKLVNRGRGISQKVLTIIESSDKPLSSQNIYEGLDYSEASQRGTLNHLTKMNSGSLGVYLFSRGVYGVRKHLLLDDDEIELIVEKINSHTLDENKDKQFHCKEALEQVDFFPTHKKLLNPYTLAICLRLTNTFNYLGHFMFVRTGSSNTQVQRKDFTEMALDILEKSPEPLAVKEIKSIISQDRGIPTTAQLHKRGKLIPFRNHLHPKNHKTIKWGLIDVHLNISKQQLVNIIIEMESVIKNYNYQLTPDQGIEAIKGNSILEQFQDKILILFVLLDKNINFIEKKNHLFHVNGTIDNLSQVDCLKIVGSKISEKGMTKQEIFKQIESLYGSKVPYNILSRLGHYGLSNNKSSDTWHKGEMVEY
jgi:hypothetical protein